MATTDHILTDLDFSLDFEVRQEAAEELGRRINAAPVDTRGALASFVPNADPYQRQVIDAPETTIRLVAPAGSGKTQTVANRVLSRVRDGLNPARILVLTFDNAAATSLKEQLRSQTEKIEKQASRPVDLRGLTVSTLNAFGYALLRQDVPGEFRPVIERWRARRLLREVKQALRAKSPDRHAALPAQLEDRFYLEFFSLLKNQLFDPRRPDAQRVADFMLAAPQATPFFPTPSDLALVRTTIQAALWLFMGYERLLQRDGVLDFDDQKLRAYLALDADPGLLRAVQGRYSEVVVDEFQDINHLDFEFVRAVAVKANLVVTGDDDQAIYGFRGCTPDFIIDLERHLGRPVASYELSTNYRCPANVVTHADRLIRHNTRRIEKNPIAHRREQATIKVASTLSAGLEAKSIVAFIHRVRKATPDRSYRDFAVLYRTNAQSLPLQVEFILDGLPYFVRDEDNILDNQVLGLLLGVLRLKLALAAGRPPSVEDQVLTIRAYFRYLNGEDLDLSGAVLHGAWDFLSAIRSEEFHAALPRARLSQFPTAVEEVLRAKTLLDELGVLAKRFGGLSGMVGSLEDVVDQRAPLAELSEVAANIGGGTAAFVDLMDRALERGRATGAGRDRDGVALLTYFKAKGLQWQTVILTTCNEGLIPHRKAPGDDERRLFYVALTRATSNLFVSYLSNACNTRVAPSRFLAEAGLLP